MSINISVNCARQEGAFSPNLSILVLKKLHGKSSIILGGKSVMKLIQINSNMDLLWSP